MLSSADMRALSAVTALLVAALAHAQPAPNAVRLTKYILGVADLDRTYAFYHALGLELQNGGSLNKPNPLPDPLLKLVDVPAGTKFRNMMLKIPNAPFLLEVTEFSNMELHPAKLRIQDPGASVLILSVADVDGALRVARSAGAEVVTTGGSPVAVRYAKGDGRAVTVKDPDGYYVELGQPPDSAGAGILGARFGSVVQDAAKSAAFYRDNFGFEAKVFPLGSGDSKNTGTPGAQIRTADILIPGMKRLWTFGEFQGVERKSNTPRIPDPGAPAVGLQVHDIDAAIKAVKAAGGTSITEGGSLQLGPNGKVGFVRDPSGILVELAEP
jgi:catechol 2,3-dioxygenase-like lactoylglutathione lyase family enzyme